MSGALAIMTCAVSLARADILITFAENPVSVIRGASLYRAGAGVKLRDGDIVKTDTGQAAQIEDGTGTLIALGPQTQLLLTSRSMQQHAPAGLTRISMLSGWLKTSCMVSIARQQPVSIELPGLNIRPTRDGAWTLVAMATAQRIALFAEIGDDAIERTVRGSQFMQTLGAGQYVERDADTSLRTQARPSAEFVGALPPPFRDALVGLSDHITSRQDLAAPVRPVDYDDVSDWLASDVSERKTFVTRFASRLKSASFRAQIDAHLNTLPEWRPILHPPPQAPATRHKAHAQTLPASRKESDTALRHDDDPATEDIHGQ
ncbi:hypothetical protein [Burkholderia sp. 8Y]|uniref:hypothetical protein n=1 Tax=Burkholderia sp. 8Y TaxID=2653133 RepID=UPI001357EE30|nr:hypothetical protein [Burkholderia sp. 8Y]